MHAARTSRNYSCAYTGEEDLRGAGWDTLMPTRYVAIKSALIIAGSTLHVNLSACVRELSCRRPSLLSLPVALSRPSRIGSSDLHTNDDSVPLFIRISSRWTRGWTVATLSINLSYQFHGQNSERILKIRLESLVWRFGLVVTR